jgi:uracil-DNA glycosylase family 4
LSADIHAALQSVVRDLEGHVRLLRDFGLRQVAQRSAEVVEEIAAQAAAVADETQAPARAADPVAPPRGRAQSHLFAPPEAVRARTTAAAGVIWSPNPLDAGGAQAELDALLARIGDCTRCPLSRNRNRIVFGEGNPVARLALVGEGPGFEEDRTGRPFVGPAGQLLEKILSAMGLDREQVYICNVVKCRPPQNRTPEDEEMRTCGQFLVKQLSIVRPRHILCMGGTATRYLLNTDQPMGRVRGRFFDHAETGARIMPTYHPAYLLRNEQAKRLVWEDVQQVMAEMKQPVQGE